MPFVVTPSTGGGPVQNLSHIVSDSVCTSSILWQLSTAVLAVVMAMCMASVVSLAADLQYHKGQNNTRND